MKKTLLFIAIALAAGTIGLFGYASTQPDTFHISRSITIQAPADAIYPYLSDFELGQKWSPYEKKDPEMKREFAGAKSGKGAEYLFDGNAQVGAGKITIAEAYPPHHVVLKLEMFRPFETSHTVTYIVAPTEGGNEMTWEMEGEQTFLGKIIFGLLGGEHMVGKDMEEGLANLKTLAESA